jgi:SH3 domain-containing YSC84-like protein 1
MLRVRFRRKFMSKKHLVAFLAALALLATVPAVARASDREDDMARIRESSRVFNEIMSTPDKGIPQELLEKARCIAIIPGTVKFAFVLGGHYGRGLAVCRTGHGWSAPLFLAVEGGSVGYQIGGSSTDLVLLFMNNRALDHLLSDKFSLGADAAVAAGPVGRHASAATDVAMHAEILSYSRSRGVFAGVSLNGTVVHADKSADEAMYGAGASRHELIDGNVPVPAAAQGLVSEISRYAREARMNS